MTFPYTAGIPNPPNNPSQDVPVMQTNANTINSWVQVDHTGFNNANAGIHKQVTFALNQAAPGFPNGVSDLFVNNTSGTSQLFFQNAMNIVQLTGLTLVTSGTDYGVTTPWGLILNFGKGSANTGITPITFAVPMPTNALAITTGQDQFTGILKVSSFTLTQAMFSYSNSGGTGFWYIALGN